MQTTIDRVVIKIGIEIMAGETAKEIGVIATPLGRK